MTNTPQVPSSLPLWRQLLLLLLGLLLVAGYASFSFFALLDPPFVLRYIGASFVLFALYGWAAWLSRDLHGGWLLGLLLFLGLLQALCMVHLAPSMSDDLYRYIWDGRMQAHGWNPFWYPPSSTQIEGFIEHKIHGFINHPDYRTVYPPMAQLLFWLAYVLTPGSWLGYKLLQLFFHICVVVLLGLWLKRRQLPMGRLLWYAWCPLPLFEVMLDGHLDGFAPALLLLALLAAQKRRPWLCGVALAAAILVKPLPLFVMPALLWHLRWRKAFQMALAFSLTCLLLYLPYLDAGAFLFKSLIAYSRHWSFNGPVYSLLNIWIVSDVCRLIGALCVIGAALFVPFTRLPLEQKVLVPLLVYLITAPTLYSWYLVWLVPWLVMIPRLWLFWLVGTVLASHFVHYEFSQANWWRLPLGVMVFEFGPFFLLLFADLGGRLLQMWNETQQRRQEALAATHQEQERLRQRVAFLEQEIALLKQKLP